MAQRDLIATASKARDKFPPAYQLSVQEVLALMRLAQDENKPDGLMNAIIAAFRYGQVLGLRASERGLVKGL